MVCYLKKMHSILLGKKYFINFKLQKMLLILNLKKVLLNSNFKKLIFIETTYEKIQNK